MPRATARKPRRPHRRTAANDAWGTPQPFFDTLHAEFEFELDAAATPELAKCSRFYTPEQDGLAQPWAPFRTWVNPPWGGAAGGVTPWIRKAYEESLRGALVVVLVKATTEIGWFHDFVLGKAEIRFVQGRLNFEGSTSGNTIGSLVAVFYPPGHPGQTRVGKVFRTNRAGLTIGG